MKDLAQRARELVKSVTPVRYTRMQDYQADLRAKILAALCDVREADAQVIDKQVEHLTNWLNASVHEREYWQDRINEAKALADAIRRQEG